MKTWKTWMQCLCVCTTSYLVLGFMSLTAQADVYRWVTPNGTIAYGDRPPVSGTRVERVTGLPSESALVDESDRLDSSAPEALAQAEEVRDGGPEGLNLQGADLVNVNLAELDLTHANLQQVNLQGAALTEVNLAWADLREADLSGAQLNGAGLQNASLFLANLRSANLTRADMRGAFVVEANLADADLGYADLSGGSLRGATLVEANLARTNLTAVPLVGANLLGARLPEALLMEADLRAADLVCADLRGVNLVGADLSGAVLRGADLSGANVQGANLRDADLRNANLRWANFQGADFTRTNLRGANLTRAYLADVTGLTREQRAAGYEDEEVYRFLPSWTRRQEGPWTEIAEWDRLEQAPQLRRVDILAATDWGPYASGLPVPRETGRLRAPRATPERLAQRGSCVRLPERPARKAEVALAEWHELPEWTDWPSRPRSRAWYERKGDTEERQERGREVRRRAKRIYAQEQLRLLRFGR